MSHHTPIEKGMIGCLYNDKKLMIVVKVEEKTLICHRFRHDNRFIRINKTEFKRFKY